MSDYRCGNCETPHESTEEAAECCACPVCWRVKELPDKWSVGEKFDNEQQIEARRDCADELLEVMEKTK